MAAGDMTRSGYGLGIPGRDAVEDVEPKTRIRTVTARDKMDGTEPAYEVRTVGDHVLIWGLTGPLATAASIEIELTDDAGIGGTNLFLYRPMFFQVLPDVSSIPSAGGLTIASGVASPDEVFKVGVASHAGYDAKVSWVKVYDHWRLTITNAGAVRDFAFTVQGV